MIPARFLVVPMLLVLAACGTPQQQCIGAATKDLRTVEGLIRQTQTNIARGYAYVSVVRTVPEYVDCTPHATKANPDPEPQMCLVDTAQTFQQPVAIDLALEQKKLDQLLAKRAELTKAAQPQIADCQAAYPEG